MKIGSVPVAGSNGVIGYHDTARGNYPCITVGRSGSVGKVHYYEQPTWAHNTALFVKISKEMTLNIYTTFLRIYIWMRCFQKEVASFHRLIEKWFIL